MKLRLLISFVFASFSRAEEIPFYIGTHSEEGIYKAYLDTNSGRISEPSLAVQAYYANALSLSKDKRTLFSVGRIPQNDGDSKVGSVYAFRVGQDFSLELLCVKSSGGDGPCFIFSHRNGSNLFVANYGSGSVSSYKIASGGTMGSPVTTVQHNGSSVNEKRQRGPHAHSIYTSPDGKYVYAADLGTDEVVYYSLDPTSAEIQRISEAELPPGSGPRHMAFSQDGTLLYVLNELNLSITKFDRNSYDGSLSILETKPITTGAEEGFSSSEIKMSADHKFLYAAKRDLEGRGRDLICVMDPDSLEILQEHPAGASIPRHFNISPCGEWLLVAGQGANEVVTHKRNVVTGTLTDSGYRASVKKPMWILFPH